jgi:hypothetical protein
MIIRSLLLNFEHRSSQSHRPTQTNCILRAGSEREAWTSNANTAALSPDEAISLALLADLVDAKTIREILMCGFWLAGIKLAVRRPG